MYCPYKNGECYLQSVDCRGCFDYQAYWNKIQNFPKQQYNYKCTCGGEFMTPICTVGTSVYNYKCPFCGKPMEGMNG